MHFRIRPGSKVLFIGASTTDAQRARPYAEGPGDELGRGYVALIDATLGAYRPADKIRVLNMGVSGNTVRDLKARWEADVLAHRPDWLSILIGINDVWRQFDSPKRTETHVLLAEYEKTLDALIRKTKPRLKGGLILAAPFFIEPNPKEPMRALMDRYGAVVKKLAARHRAVFVDTQAAFAPALKHLHPATLAWDRIHPNQTGHLLIARAFLEALGFEWA
ncbi:MAG: SGNH/GDSL hydrolase family protein [Verrucomicrobium sp.]|nr:SGNH/GDSL hydrolase family protein [Verrucomicrobium sp.]